MTGGDFWLAYSAMSSGSNSFANRLSSFSYVDSYIFRPQLLWRTTQPVERDTERYTERDTFVSTGPVGRSVRSGPVGVSPHIHSNCDLKVAIILCYTVLLRPSGRSYYVCGVKLRPDQTDRPDRVSRSV